MPWIPRIAQSDDIPALEDLIPMSAFALQKDDYTPDQIQAAMGSVFGVDTQLITDGTFFVVEDAGGVVGCGGWSFRKSRYGGDAGRADPDPPLDPTQDPARVRAFFIGPDYARRGIGSAIMAACEAAIAAMNFTHVEIAATLAGERLYAKFGYETVEQFEIPLPGCSPMPVVRMIKAL